MHDATKSSPIPGTTILLEVEPGSFDSQVRNLSALEAGRAGPLRVVALVRTSAEAFTPPTADPAWSLVDAAEGAEAWTRAIALVETEFVCVVRAGIRMRWDALDVLAAELRNRPEAAGATGDSFLTDRPGQDFTGHLRCGLLHRPAVAGKSLFERLGWEAPILLRTDSVAGFAMGDDAAAFPAQALACRAASVGALRTRREFLFLETFGEGFGPDRQATDPRLPALRSLRAQGDALSERDDGGLDLFVHDAEGPSGRWVNVLTVTFNRLDYTRKTIDGLVATMAFPHGILVVDNASTDGSREYLLEQYRNGVVRKVLLLDRNVGLARGINIGWRHETGSDFLLKLDNDMVFQRRGWLEAVVEASDRVPQAAVLGYSVEPRSYPASLHNGVSLRVKADANVGGGCVFLSNRTRDRFGYFCEDYGLYGEEDGDLGLRVRLEGCINAYMDDEDVAFHLPSGKAGAIDPKTLKAVDPMETEIDPDYRRWKDEQRAHLQKNGGILQRNVIAYHSGQRSRWVPTGEFMGLLGELQVFDDIDRWSFSFHPRDGRVIPEHEEAVEAWARTQGLPPRPLRVAGHGREWIDLSKNAPSHEGIPGVVVGPGGVSFAGPSEMAPPSSPRASVAAKVSIVIPVHGHLELTKQCIQAVRATTDASTTEIVVVDDASPDQTADWLVARESDGILKAVVLKENKGFAGACNAGAAVSTGSVLVFLNNDTIPGPGWLDALVSPLSDPSIGLTGARLLYPEGDIQHAGIRLHSNGLPDHEFRHAAADDPRVSVSRDRAFVTGACIALPRGLFDRIGGFDEGFRMYVEDLDLCLKVWNEGFRVRYVAECVVVHLECRTTPDLEKRTALVKTGMERLFSRWHGRWPSGLANLPDWPDNFRPTLESVAASDNASHPAGIPASKLHWIAPVLNFTGYARLNREAILAMESAAPGVVSLDPTVNNAEFIKGLESQGTLAVAPWNAILARHPSAGGICVVSDLPCNLKRLRESRPDHERYAGLTMFETDRLPGGWRDDCLEMDEIWVPSNFNLRTFAQAGIPERMLHRIPCGIDMDRFRPGVPALPIQGRRSFNFLSVFEWTPRKGWDALLLAWARAFTVQDDVSLTLKSHLPGGASGLGRVIENFYVARGIDPKRIAPVVAIEGFLPESAMPGLYAAADAFVLPTRGEGWGLPYLEAMACGIPVLATGWSAHMDFVSASNGYVIDHDLVRVAPEQTKLSAYYGPDHLWAEPSVDHLVDLLRLCARNPAETRDRGRRARKDVEVDWSSRRTAEWISRKSRGESTPSAAIRPAAPSSGAAVRIGFDGRTFSVPDSMVRGIGHYSFHHLLAVLAERPGQDLTVLVDDREPIQPEVRSRLESAGAKFAPWSSRTAADFDLVHIADPMYVHPEFATPFQRMSGTRLSTTFYDVIPLRMYAGAVSNWPGYLARLDALRDSGAQALCISEHTRRDLIDATGLPAGRTCTVMAGFNASVSGRTWSAAEGDALLRRLGIDKPFFLHVGAVDPHKNFEMELTACQAVSTKRACQFVVVGKLSNSLAAVREQVLEAGIRDVVFTDFLPREELELLYSRAVATLFLSRYEGFGFPVLEAMAQGCPVVCSNTTSIPEVAGDAALQHSPDDLQGIAGSMLRLLESPTLRQELSSKGRSRAAMHSWGDVARRTWLAWDELLSKAAPTPTPIPHPARVQWVSPVWDPSGYGDESRAFVRHLAHTDLGVGLLAWGRHSESFRQAATVADRALFDGLMGREMIPNRPIVLDMPAHAMGRLPGAGHHVGRTTFETDGLPPDWVSRCNGMDEIWVPCAFNKTTFAKAGVTKPILVVPEGVDTDKFRPGLEPLELPGPRKATTYLAVFEWTHRKSPDLLLQAWATAFSTKDDVRLVLRTYPPNQIEGDPVAWVEAKIDEELARVGKRRADCAPIAVIAAQVPDADMPRLYAAADVYLAPSRGEGWGRPHMEAMSCGVPVIATRWSGNLDFQTDGNSWLIDIDGLEEIDVREEFPFYRGQKWAKPSMASFVRLLRESRDDHALRQRKGERARRDMVEKWDWSRIAPLAETRLREILAGTTADRSELAKPAPTRSTTSNSVTEREAIRWAGPVFNYSGYARLARETLKGLMDAGMNVSCDPQLNDKEFFAALSGKDAEIGRWRSLLGTQPTKGPLVICDIPRDTKGADILAAISRDNSACDKRVCWTMFETDRIPEGWASALNTMDEVWVPSNFNRNTFARAGVLESKLHVIPGCIDATPYATALPMRLPGSGYTFLSVFQWIERKGWDVLLDAWSRAFKATDPVRLVLRCHPFGNAEPVSRQLEQFLSSRGLRRQDLAPIHLIEEFLPDDALPSLFAACDCFALPSRGEGWGLPYLEAMAAGKPVIGTRWSAQTDFLTPDNSWQLSPRDPVDVGDRACREVPFLDISHRWADPSPVELAKILRHAFAHPEEGIAKGRQGRVDATSKWTPANTVRAIADRLAPPSPTTRPGPSTSAFAPVRQARVSEGLAKVASGLKNGPRVAVAPSVATSPTSDAADQFLSIRWEGSQFVHHSLANVNRELCLRLANRGHDLSLIPFEPNQFGPDGDPDLSLLERLHDAPLEGTCQIHVRHQWPPNLTRPSEGKWVVVQPWEFGSPPKDWISVFSKQLDDLWVPSNYCRDLYVSGGMPADRVHVVPNGVDCDKFRPGLAPYPLRTKKRFKFVYVGGTIARKGFDVLLNAWKEAFGPHDDVCLVVKDMGGGSFYKGQTAKAWIQEMQDSRQYAEIEYIDAELTPRQIPSIYAACDVLVHPYRGEGFGLPIAEAMACGLPCIITRGGAADDFCGEAESWGIRAERVPVPGGKVGPFETVSEPWWFEPSAPHLVERLREAFTDTAARKAKGEAARERIANHFTWEQAAAIAEHRLFELSRKEFSVLRPAPGKLTISSLDKLAKSITMEPAKQKPSDAQAPKARADEDDMDEMGRMLLLAEASAARGGLGEADRITEEVVAKFPRQHMAWLARAMVLRGLGKFKKAADAIAKAIQQRETPEALLEAMQIHLLADEAAPARKAEKALKERHAVWFNATREDFRSTGKPWPPDFLKPTKAKAAPPARRVRK